MLAENKSYSGYNTIEDQDDPERSLDDVCRIHLTWENITVSKKAQTSKICGLGKMSEEMPTMILNDVSGFAKPGDFVAILGASGSGKTTFLNTFSYRLSPGLAMTGNVKVNGRAVAQEEMRRISGYVGQNDTFVGSMTVIEVIIFYANLKLDPSISGSTKQNMADKILRKVGLSNIKNSLVGDTYIPGISGGEKTRLAVATQLLLGASLLFLDEVTSGLDTFMAESVLKMMKDLADWGCTILCTIHQPASELYAMFDKVCLMSEGNVAFLGNKSDALTFFEESYYPCPSNYCPTDHFIYTLAIRPGDEVNCRERCMHLVKSYRESRFFLKVTEGMKTSVTQFENNSYSKINILRKGTFCNQLFRNIQRSFKESVRNPRSSRMRLISGVLVALMVGFFYFRTRNDMHTVKEDKSGLLFLLILVPAIRSLNYCALTFPLTFHTTQREHQDGLYSSLAYFLSVVICEIPYVVFINLVQYLIIWVLVGLKMEVIPLLNAVCCVAITSWASSGAGWLIGAIAGPQPVLAAQAAATTIFPFFMFAGVLKTEFDTPIYLYPFKYLSWLRYGCRMLMVNEFRDLELHCGDEPCAKNGTAILLDMGINPDELWWPNMAASTGIGLGFMVAAWFILACKLKRQ